MGSVVSGRALNDTYIRPLSQSPVAVLRSRIVNLTRISRMNRVSPYLMGVKCRKWGSNAKMGVVHWSTKTGHEKLKFRNWKFEHCTCFTATRVTCATCVTCVTCGMFARSDPGDARWNE